MKTEVIRVDPVRPDNDAVSVAASYLRKGNTVAFPTETVYGLGANALDRDAVAKIFKVKGRPHDNPLLLHVSSFEMAQRCVSEDMSRYSRLTDRLWPGPVTLILQKSAEIPLAATAGLETVGIRFPAHPVARLMIELAGVPVAAPSANLSGKPSPTEEAHVLEDLMDQVPCILLAGKTVFGLESTIIDLTQDPPVLLRPGPISPEQLRETLGDIAITVSDISDERVPKAPGMKYRHYSPGVDLILIQGDLEQVVEEAKNLVKASRSVILCCEEHEQAFASVALPVVLGSMERPYEIAMNLFAALRRLSEMDLDLAIAESYPEKGIGLAIMNRLSKAASKIIRV